LDLLDNTISEENSLQEQCHNIKLKQTHSDSYEEWADLDLTTEIEEGHPTFKSKIHFLNKIKLN